MKINLTGSILCLLAGVAISDLAQGVANNSAGVKTMRLTAVCRGSGVIRPDYNGKNLVVGKIYTVVARANSRFVFTNWTGGYEAVITNISRLTFVMNTNTVIIANFLKRETLGGLLDGVSTAQLPLKVLAAVNAAPPEKQSQVLGSWIIEIAAVHPSALPSVVATVVSAHPELLKTAVSDSVTADPSEAYDVVYAAAKTSPADIAITVGAASNASPTDSYQIAQATLDADPTAGKLVLQTIANTVPELKTYIDDALGNNVVLDRNQTLTILSQSLVLIHWPTIPAPPNQTPTDYAKP